MVVPSNTAGLVAVMTRLWSGGWEVDVVEELLGSSSRRVFASCRGAPAAVALRVQ